MFTAGHRKLVLLLFLSFRFPTTSFSTVAKSLFPYQMEGVQRLLQSKRILLGDEMGLGKTVQTIEAINQLSLPRDAKILILCPKSLLDVWKNELHNWLSVPFLVQLAATTKVPEFVNRSITVMNYDICHKHRSQLMDTFFDILICDEAHYLKNKDAMRTKAVLGDGSKSGIPSDRLWLLSGTPVLNRPLELYPLLRAIDPTEFGSFKAFADRYCDPKTLKDSRGNYRKDYSGAKNLGELAKRLSPIMIRRYKSDVLNQLPPKFRSCKCLLDSGEADLERERIKDILMERSSYDDSLVLEDFGSHASSLIQYLGRDVNLNDPKRRNEIMGLIATVRRQTAISKVDAAIDLLENLIVNEKVVVFAHHREVIHKLVDAFGSRAVCVLGGMNVDDRSDAVFRFQNDPNARMFVGSIRAAGVGLTLTASSRVVFLEFDWSPAVMSQAEDRCHRIGARGSILIEYYVFPNTIDEWIARSLMTKQSNIDKILPVHQDAADTKHNFVFDFGVYEGIRLEDAPQNYIEFLVQKEIWRQHPRLWNALYSQGRVQIKPETVASRDFDRNAPATMNKAFDPPNVERRSDQRIGISSIPSADVIYTFDFGMHKGKLWSDAPVSYRDWVIQKAVYDNRPILKEALRAAGLI